MSLRPHLRRCLALTLAVVTFATATVAASGEVLTASDEATLVTADRGEQAECHDVDHRSQGRCHASPALVGTPPAQAQPMHATPLTGTVTALVTPWLPPEPRPPSQRS